MLVLRQLKKNPKQNKKGKRLCSNQKVSKWQWCTPEVKVSQIPNAFTGGDMHFCLFGSAPHFHVLWYPGLVPLLSPSSLFMSNFTKLLLNGIWVQFDKAVGLFCLIFLVSISGIQNSTWAKLFFKELVSTVKLTCMGLSKFYLGHTT